MCLFAVCQPIHSPPLSTDTLLHRLLTLHLYHLPFPSSPLLIRLKITLHILQKTRKKMAKLLLLFALCLLPAIATAGFVGNPFLVSGKVYCDTCRCGYETTASKYLPGSLVKIVCKDRDTSRVTYEVEGVTDSSGTYNILVQSDRGDDLCDAVLVKSSDPECSTPNSGRDKARVILTRNNGMVSDARFANAMGFSQNVPLASCPQILQKYQEAED